MTGVLLESDQTFDVVAGDEVTAADLRLPPQLTAAERRAQVVGQGALPAAVCLGTAMTRVRVTTVSGEPLAGASVRLTSAGPGGSGTALISGNETTRSNGT